MRLRFVALAAFAVVLPAQASRAQDWQLWRDRQNIWQDRTQMNADRNRFFQDINNGNSAAAWQDLRRLQADQRLLNADRQQYWYDRSQAYGPYYGQTQYVYPQSTYYQTQPTYYQPQATTYYQQPAAPTYAVQRYLVPAQYAGTPAGYVISYGGVNYLTAGDGTMTPYGGAVAR